MLKCAVCAIICALVFALPAAAHDLTIAVAANFTDPARDIAAAFEKKTGTHVVMSFGPSGGFFTQIENGAPFEVFLSADADRPARLETDGYGVKDSRFAYAYGGLVLWSATPGRNVQDMLAKGQFAHLAIADPAAAPYGTAAVEAMTRLGVYDATAPRIVKGTSIAQAFSFVDSGAADLGFIALSQIYKAPRGSLWIVPKEDYAPIVQQAVLLTPGAADPAARAYVAFLKSPEAVAIITSYGYGVAP